MGGYSFQLEYSIFSPKSKVHFMQPILKRQAVGKNKEESAGEDEETQ